MLLEDLSEGGTSDDPDDVGEVLEEVGTEDIRDEVFKEEEAAVPDFEEGDDFDSESGTLKEKDASPSPLLILLLPILVEDKRDRVFKDNELSDKLMDKFNKLK